MKYAVRIFTLAVFVGLSLQSACLLAATDGPSPRNKESKFVIARTEAEAPTKLNIEDINRQWPVFPHEDWGKSGFNHLTLPFHTSTNAAHAREEARAFAFLLSNALDLVPGSYCARHAYFVFKRARPDMLALEKTYDPKAIALQLKSWRATHAIGGEIIKVQGGYTGKLQIFDKTGKMALEKTYEKPRSYFDLLGDMCDDFSAHVGHKPSAALSAHFHKPRCEKEESIWDLGSAAFKNERTDDEFSCYRKIIERDPAFAEVRYWIANQDYWKHKNKDLYQQEEEKCLESYLVEAVMSGHIVTKKNVAKYEGFINTAESLVGANSPFVMECRLAAARAKGCTTPQLIKQAVVIASQYPNANALLSELRRAVYSPPEGMADADLAIALSLTQLGSPYMRGSSDQDRYIIKVMSMAIAELGREDIAIVFAAGNARNAMEDGDVNGCLEAMTQLVTMLRATRQYDSALKVGSDAVEIMKKTKVKADDLLFQTAVCAAFAGEKRTFSDLYEQFKTASNNMARLTILGNYQQFMDNKPVNLEQLTSFAGADSQYGREATVLLAEADLAGGTTNQIQNVTTLLKLYPNDREFWILYDAYNRKHPQQDSGLFYESLAWVHPESSWVLQAVKDYRARVRPPVSPDVADYVDILKTVAPDTWNCLKKKPATILLVRPIPYGGIALAARKLVAEGKKDQALDMINQYQTYAYGTGNGGHPLRAYCNHLLHMLDIAELTHFPDFLSSK